MKDKISPTKLYNLMYHFLEKHGYKIDEISVTKERFTEQINMGCKVQLNESS